MPGSSVPHPCRRPLKMKGEAVNSHDIRNPVVAGVTRSDASRAAVAWAADEAARQHRPLRLIHVQQWPMSTAEEGPPGHPSNLWKIHFHALGQSTLETARLIALNLYPELEVRTKLAEGRPGQVLRDAAEDGSLLVLGAHRAIEVEEMFSFGGIGASLVGHPPCPVALVFAPARIDEANGSVVVGVDGSAASESAVALAFEEAALRSADLVAVEVRRSRRAEVPGAVQESLLDVSEAVAGWGEKFPGVRVRHEVLGGNPAMALAKYAVGARCLVVGSRGIGGFRGLVLGSTSRTLVHHAPCPLIVVPPTSHIR